MKRGEGRRRGVMMLCVTAAVICMAIVCEGAAAEGGQTPWVKVCGKASLLSASTVSLAGAGKHDADLCVTQQDIYDGRTGAVLVSVAVHKAQGGAQMLRVRVPTGLAMLPFGAQGKIDEGEPIKFRFTYCDAEGCVAEAGASASVLAKMKTGQKFVFAVAKPDRTAIAFPAPLDGFGRTYDGVPADLGQYRRDREKLRSEIVARVRGNGKEAVARAGEGPLGPVHLRPIVAHTPWRKICGSVAAVGAKFYEKQETFVCLTQKESFSESGLVQFSVAIRQTDGMDREQLEVLVPPGLAQIAAGAEGRVNQGSPFKLRFLFCHALGCILEAEAPRALVTSMKGGAKLGVVLQGVDGKRIAFAMSLDGFGGSYDGPRIATDTVNAERKRIMSEIKARWR